MRQKNAWNKKYETVDGTEVLSYGGLKASPKEIAFRKHINKILTNKKGESK